jgi:hypothetical protein
MQQPKLHLILHEDLGFRIMGATAHAARDTVNDLLRNVFLWH